MDRTFSPNISEKNCFDFLRFVFAFSVFCSHFGDLTLIPIQWPISASVGVAGFFIISGFLIMRSYYKSSGLFDYVLKRIKRIVPAYFLVVIGCVLFLSFIGSLSFNEYFSSKELYKYLIANLSFLNFIHPTLPGVFESNYYHAVNGSLWTIKIELSLYAFIPFLALFIKRKPIKVFLLVYFLSFIFFSAATYFSDKFDNEFLSILRRQFFGQVIYFISGVILLFYFDEIKARIKFILPIAVLAIILKYYTAHWIMDLFFPFSLATVIIWFAYYFKKLSVFSKYGDCSYGFYLFHYPTIQIFINLGWFKQNPILLFIACFFIILLFSFLSWHLLEKKFLKRKFLSDNVNIK